MAEQEQTQEVEISNPVLGRLAAKGVRISDMIGLLTLIVVIAIGFLGWQTIDALGTHKVEAAQSNTALTGAIKNLAQSQRMMTCILSQPQDKREQEFIQPNSFCQRMASLP